MWRYAVKRKSCRGSWRKWPQRVRTSRKYHKISFKLPKGQCSFRSPQLASDRATSCCFLQPCLLTVWRRFLMTKWRSWMMQASSHRSLFLDNERYNNILREVKEAQILRKNNQPLTSNITGIVKDTMPWRSVIRRNLRKMVQAKMMIKKIGYYCKTKKLFDVLETAHVNMGHKRTTGKRQYFVCDSQKHSL